MYFKYIVLSPETAIETVGFYPRAVEHSNATPFS